jgi:energy-coupling factor transporter ATP-binding protein EcfA2
MIKSIKVLEGYATNLEGIKDKNFEFSEGFNCLFGPNGCGKSSILKIIKAYCAIEKGGWSCLSDPIKLPATLPSHFPAVYSIYSPGNCIAKVDWDGSPSFFNEGDVKIDGFSWFFTNEKMSEDGITNGDEHLENMATKPSSGQYRLQKLNKIFNILENPPKITAKTPEGQYISSLPRNGKITILLDEPERALSLPKQMELFDILSNLSEKYQIIVATHSPFILFQENVEIFDFEKNYSQLCINIFKNCVKSYLENKYKKQN